MVKNTCREPIGPNSNRGQNIKSDCIYCFIMLSLITKITPKILLRILISSSIYNYTYILPNCSHYR
uniref:Uncharacterized protein n=1 Tax=Octopus bimaculoides TaxID=37653 RepID=A0A0L8HPN5_OCTBM